MEILYDANGNMKDHKDKGILQIDYNILDLPDLVKFDKTYVPRFTGMELDYNVKSKFLYRADGVKLRKIYTYGDGKANMEASTITDYLDGFQYEENYTGSLSSPVLKFVPTSEGYYDFEKNKYIYNYTDHLGNVRLSYFKNSNGGAEVLEENNYYPFGIKHDADFISSGNPSSYNYQYNGKEYQKETGWYDYGARMYMSDIARWGVIDPLAEQMRRYSPYNYAFNNPANFIDPDGNAPYNPRDFYGHNSAFSNDFDPNTTIYGEGSFGGYKYFEMGLNYDGGSSGGISALMNTMLNLGEDTWINKGYDFESSGHIALGYDGSYISLNTTLDILIPEIIMKGEGSEWNGSSYNKAVLSSRITGALGNWNYDVNSGNMGQYIMNSKASMEVAEFEKFLFLELPASFAGGEFISAGWRAAGVTGRIGNALSKITTADGFMGGSIGFKLPFNLRVGLYASENTLKYETFKWSTIAPKALTKYEWFGRNMLQITPEFQSTLGNWSTQVIPKGTYIRIGLVGQQPGNALGTWLQFYAPGRVPFVP